MDEIPQNTEELFVEKSTKSVIYIDWKQWKDYNNFIMDKCVMPPELCLLYKGKALPDARKLYK